MELAQETRSLLDALEESSPWQRYKKAEAAMEKDLESMRIKRYYERAQEKLQGLLAAGELPQDILNNDFEELKGKYQANQLIQEYLQAREVAQQLVQQVITEITTTTGFTAQRGCGGGCCSK